MRENFSVHHSLFLVHYSMMQLLLKRHQRSVTNFDEARLGMIKCEYEPHDGRESNSNQEVHQETDPSRNAKLKPQRKR